MVREQCVVPFCMSRRGQTKGLSFHEFPNDENIRKLWMDNICRQQSARRTEKWCPNDNSRICGLHFEPSAYKEGVKVKRLKKMAVPSIFPEFPAHIQSRIQERSKPKRKAPAVRIPSTERVKFKKRIVEPVSEVDDLQQFAASNEELRPSPAIAGYVPACIDAHQQPHLHKTPLRTSSIWGKRISPRKIRKKLKDDCNLSYRLRRENKRLQEKVRSLNSEISPLRNAAKKMTRLTEDARNGISQAAILLEQVDAYGRKWHRWSEHMIRQCILWRSKSAPAYEHARRLAVFRLPCSTTLKSYLGVMSTEFGMTSNVKLRLQQQVQELTAIEKYSSVIFDEMSIKPMLTYVKHKGQLFGAVNFGNYRKYVKFKNNKNVIANRLLCFVMKGISTDYIIPVAYFLVRQLTAEQLVPLITNILKDLEEIGFKIIRLVADDYKVNQKTFRLLSGGDEAKPVIQHPVNSTRPLFLFYDYCHIMKNIRNNFLNRDLVNKEKPINSKLLHKMKDVQDKLTIKPVRSLTRRMLNPTNFEKMKVVTAVRLFSQNVISGLEFFQSTGAAEFSDIDSTVEFMKIMKKWWEINDVCNVSNHTKLRNENKESFWRLSDSRLSWLESDFIQYLDSWKASTTVRQKVVRKAAGIPSTKKKRSTQYLTRDTDLAIRLTTQSTVLCIRYLIRIGFQFVLTRKFSGDSVEYFFSGLRQMGGRFDQMNAVSSMCALDKIIKIGMISASTNSNIGNRETATSIFSNTTRLPTGTDVVTENSSAAFFEMEAKLLEDPPDIEAITVEVAGSTMVTGFLCKIVRDNFRCPRSTSYITSSTKDSELHEFIRRQDQGGLLYPTDQLINLIFATVQILEKYLPQIRTWEETAKCLQHILSGPFQDSGIIQCGCEDRSHSLNIQNLMLKHLIKIFLQNVARNVSEIEDKPKSFNKPECRKVLKL